MKLTIFFVFVIFTSLQALKLPIVDLDIDISIKWKDFQKKFNKTYESVDELNKRLLIFTKNVAEYAEHNILYKLGKVTYTQGINQFSDWTSDEFMAYVNRGLKKTTITSKIIRNSRSTNEQNITLPSHVDWRDKGAVTPVKDQGFCGACYAFSSAAVLESHLQLSKGKLISLSEQNLIDCSWAQNNDGCDGGLMTNAYDFVKLNGIKSEKDYPYRQTDGTCINSQNNIIDTINGYVNINQGDEKDLQTVLATIGPVSVGMDATFVLQSYESGILDDQFCTTYELNHAVLAVGYGVENGVEYYIAKNSWGEYWGEKGYFRIVRNKNNRCGITTMASYPLI